MIMARRPQIEPCHGEASAAVLGLVKSAGLGCAVMLSIALWLVALAVAVMVAVKDSRL